MILCDSVGRLFYGTMRSTGKKVQTLYYEKMSKVGDYKIGLMLHEILYKTSQSG